MQSVNEDIKQDMLEKGYMDENNVIQSKAMQHILGKDYYSTDKKPDGQDAE